MCNIPDQTIVKLKLSCGVFFGLVNLLEHRSFLCLFSLPYLHGNLVFPPPPKIAVSFSINCSSKRNVRSGLQKKSLVRSQGLFRKDPLELTAKCYSSCFWLDASLSLFYFFFHHPRASRSTRGFILVLVVLLAFWPVWLGHLRFPTFDIASKNK